MASMLSKRAKSDEKLPLKVNIGSFFSKIDLHLFYHAICTLCLILKQSSGAMNILNIYLLDTCFIMCQVLGLMMGIKG